MLKGIKKEKKKAKKETPPSSYDLMPNYFLTEQVDIVRKLLSVNDE